MATAESWSWAELEPMHERLAPQDPEVVAAQEEARMEAIRQEAYLQGLEEGVARGRTEARKELASSLAVTHQVVDAVRGVQDEWVANLEENLAAVAVAIARKLVAREFEADPELLAELIRNGLTHFPSDQPVRIRVNPRDLTSIASSEPGEGRVSGSRQARWIGDESISPGSFILEGPERVLDGRVDQALERLYRSMTHE